MPDESGWMTTGEVARYLSVTIMTVNRWIQAGKLPFIRTPGGRYRIPRAEFLAMVQKGSVPVAGARPTLKVMVVDDEPANRDLIREFLGGIEGLSIQVEVAVDGLAAADRIPDFAPHLLFVDLMMPRMTGFELCGFIRGHPKTRNARIVIVTGYGNAENLSAVQKCGAHRVLQKPFLFEALQDAVRELGREVLPEAFG